MIEFPHPEGTYLSLWRGAVVKPVAWRDEIGFILASTALKHGFTVAQLKGEGQRPPIARARHEVMHRMRGLLDETGRERLSFYRIGQILGGRHHTTIMNGCDRHEALTGGAA